VTVKSMIVVLAESSGENEGLARRQVMKRRNSLASSISVPPTFTKEVLPLIMTYFSKTGSNMGSTSFSIFSMISVKPLSMQNFKNISLNLGCERVVIQRSGVIEAENLFLIQPCPYP
jgi:hypothetical protein